MTYDLSRGNRVGGVQPVVFLIFTTDNHHVSTAPRIRLAGTRFPLLSVSLQNGKEEETEREREREGVKTSPKHVRPWTQDQRNFKHANLKFLSSAVVVTLLLTMLNWFLGWVMG